MELRKNIYDFIIKSNNLNIYENRKRKVAISSSFVFLISIIIIFLFFLINDYKYYFLFSGILMFISNFFYIFISIYIFMKIFEKNIYIEINNNLLEIIKKTEKNVNFEKIKELKITNKIKNYNYRKTIISSISDDVSEKITKLLLL